jgi:hypothetical protein
MNASDPAYSIFDARRSSFATVLFNQVARILLPDSLPVGWRWASQ